MDDYFKLQGSSERTEIHPEQERPKMKIKTVKLLAQNGTNGTDNHEVQWN